VLNLSTVLLGLRRRKEERLEVTLQKRPDDRLRKRAEVQRSRVPVVFRLVRLQLTRPKPTVRVQVAPAHRADLSGSGAGQELQLNHRPQLRRDVWQHGVNVRLRNGPNRV
jgi:hypothetical protein